MNYRNAFQINQYLENRMTNRASFPVLKKEIYGQILCCSIVKLL